MKLQNKVVLITASTRGIGLACVKKCALEGATVYMAARDPERAKEIAVQLHHDGASVHCVYNDATRPESFASMARDVARQAGKIDVLVNNFGASDPRTDLDILGTDPEAYLSTVTLNLGSVFRATQAVVPHMKDGGSIINISSVSGLVPDISQIGYGTSKAAINYLTKLCALQLSRRGIRCNAVLPGMTATQAVAGRLSDDFRRCFLRHVPLGRMALPEEIACAVVYFAGDESAYATGQILTLSGGFGLGTPLFADYSDPAGRG